MKKLPWLIAGVIVLIAAVIRLYQLGQVPVSLYWDEAAMLLDAKVVAATGRDIHGGPWYQVLYPSYGDYKQPVYIWLAAVIVKMLGVNDFALRLPSALAGVGTVMVVGLLSYHLSSIVQPATTKKSISPAWLMALIAMATMAISPWSIMFSRTGFEGHLGQFLVASSILTLILSRKHKAWLVLSVLLGVLATYSYFSVRFVWPVVFVVISAWLVVKQYQSIKNAIKHRKKLALDGSLLVGCILAYFLFLIPMTKSPLYEASNRYRLSTTSIMNKTDYAVASNILREQAGNTLVDRALYHRHWLMLRELGQNLADHLDLNYLFLSGDPNLRHGTTVHGLFLLPMLPLLILGLYNLAKKDVWLVSVLVGWWLIALLPASVPEDTPHALRSLNALVPLVLIMSWGGIQVAMLKQRVWGVVLLGAVVISASSFLYHYFNLYRAESAIDWQDGYTELANLIETHKDRVRTVWVSSSESRLFLWVLTYGSYTAEEIQAIEKPSYIVEQVDNISFKTYEWYSLDTLDHQVMVVETIDAMNDHLSKAQLRPVFYQEITLENGQPRYAVAILDPSQP